MKNISKISLLLVLAISLLAIGCKKAAEPVATTDETMMENTVDTTTEAAPEASTTTEAAPAAEVAATTATATI